MTTIQQLVNIHLKMVYQLRNWLPTCRLHSTHPSDVAPQELFPPHSASIHRGHVDVGDGHLIAYEISGQLNDSTAPVALHIHGGPGYHTTADDHRWFDPNFFRIVAYDQRGCGRSIPAIGNGHATPRHPASFFEATIHMDDLVNDIEKLRVALNIETFRIVFGGSWGSTVALLYAIRFPARLASLIMYGYASINEHHCAVTNSPFRYPHAWNMLAEYAVWAGQAVSAEKLRDAGSKALFAAYRTLILDQDDPNAMGLWTLYESYLTDNTSEKARKEIFTRMDAINRSVCSYSDRLSEYERSVAINQLIFFPQFQQHFGDLTAAAVLSPVTSHVQNVILVQGALDEVCPPSDAENFTDGILLSTINTPPSTGDAAQRACVAEFHLVSTASHNPYHPEMLQLLLSAVERCK